MIALRPLHGKFGPMSWTVLEGRKIPEQILKLLNIEKYKKAGMIADEKKPMKKTFKEDTDN